jgi:hypothetical protein
MERNGLGDLLNRLKNRRKWRTAVIADPLRIRRTIGPASIALGARTHKSSLLGAGLTNVSFAPVASKFRIAAK